MKLIISEFILATLLFQSVICDSLVFVQELFRHGARGPISKYWDYLAQAAIAGELTPAGYRQHYNLGKQLRKEYIDDLNFLSKDFNLKEVYVRSTDVNRTISSANAQLLGLYPKGLSLPKDLNAKYLLPPYKGVQDDTSLGEFSLPNNQMVFPVHTKRETDDIELLPWKRCDDYLPQVNIFKKENQAIIDKFNADHSAIYQRLSKLLNQDIKSYDQIGGSNGGVYDVFVADLFQNRALPELTEAELEEVRYIDSFSWLFQDVGSEIGVKQLISPFLNMLIQNFDDKISGKTPNLKWTMYSAHDSNVALTMRALNISSYQCVMDLWNKKPQTALNCHYRPEYASSFIWELLQKDTPNTYSIKIKYNGEYVKLCEKDQTECDYSEFKQRIKNYVLPDFNTGCKNKIQQSNTQNENTNILDQTFQKILQLEIFSLIVLCVLFI